MWNFFPLLLLIVVILPIVATVLAAIALARANALRRETHLLYASLSRLRDHLEVLGKRVSRPPTAAAEKGAPARSEEPPIGSVAEEASAPAPVMPLEKPQTAVSREREETVSSDLKTPTPPATEPVSPPPSTRDLRRSLRQSHQAETSAQPRWTPKLEALIGGNWLLKIGILAIVLGALYFLKYAFDNQWIGNTGRVLIGMFAGLSLLYGGETFQKKGYKLYGQTLAGGGVSILYLSIYAACNFYALIPQVPALLFMVFVTAVSCLLAARYFSKTLAVLGLLGGMLTPYWLSTGESNQAGLLTYLLILDLGIGLLARYRGWFFLNSLSFGGTFILFSDWAAHFYTREALWTTQIFLILFTALYVSLAEGMRVELEKAKSSKANLAGLFTAIVVVLLFISSQAVLAHNARYYWGFLLIFNGLALALSLRVKPNWIAPGVFILNVLGISAWILASYDASDSVVVWGFLSGVFALFLSQGFLRQKLVSAPADSWDVGVGLGTGLGYFALSYYLLAGHYLGWMGLFALALALVYLLAAGAVYRISVKTQPLALSFVGVSLTLITLAIPIELEQNWVTLGWAIESVILTWIGFASRSVRMRQAALIILSLTLLRLFLWDAVQPAAQYTLIFNQRTFTFAAVITAIYLVVLFYRRNLSTVEHWGQPVRDGLILLASGVSVFLVSQESWVYHDDKLQDLSLALRREVIGDVQYALLSDQIRNSQQLILSLLWGIYSIASVAAGILRSYRPIRLFGIALFFLAIVKVFSFDIWTLQQLYRIISVISLGCLLLAVAFLYQRFRKLIF